VESIFLDESEDIATDNLERIKALGIDIEIDDFGTGHTSIVSLLKLKPKRLKIDRQLVQPILTSPQERRLSARSSTSPARSASRRWPRASRRMAHAACCNELGCDLLAGLRLLASPLLRRLHRSGHRDGLADGLLRATVLDLKKQHFLGNRDDFAQRKPFALTAFGL
jgi:hypothetical protein